MRIILAWKIYRIKKYTTIKNLYPNSKDLLALLYLIYYLINVYCSIPLATTFSGYLSSSLISYRINAFIERLKNIPVHNLCEHTENRPSLQVYGLHARVPR